MSRSKAPAKTSPHVLRQLVYQRDRGVCALCGFDAPALFDEYKKIVKLRADHQGTHLGEEAKEFLKAAGIPEESEEKPWWEAQRKAGIDKPDLKPENYETVCTACLTKRRADARSDKKRLRIESRDAGRGLILDAGTIEIK